MLGILYHSMKQNKLLVFYNEVEYCLKQKGLM